MKKENTRTQREEEENEMNKISKEMSQRAVEERWCQENKRGGGGGLRLKEERLNSVEVLWGFPPPTAFQDHVGENCRV